jgi:DUF4097 and DUF4098 domain-containing protein YvlB
MTLRILFGLVFATGCFTHAEHVTTMTPVAVPGRIHVHVLTDDGSVRVSTADIAQVELQVVSRGYNVADDLDLSMTPHEDRVDIVAKIRHPVRMFDVTSRSLRLEVRIPRNVDVEVNSGDGSVEVDAIAGSLDIRTGDGHIAVRGARGIIRLHTGDGSIEGRDIDGSIDAVTRDGHVRLEGRFDALTVQTGDGKLTANAWPGSRMMQPWHLQTGDGSVALGLPRDLGARIDASTKDGHVRSTFPLQQLGSSHVGGDINGGGPPIVVRTGDGSIRLSQI